MPRRVSPTARRAASSPTTARSSTAPCCRASATRPDNQLTDRNTRRKLGLKADVPRMPPLGDEAARANTYISNDSDWIHFDTTIATADDQIAMAPGYLQKEWHADGRHYFHYTMDKPMLDFFSWLSARYAVKTDHWHDIPIEVYYNPAHAWNVDRMIRARRIAGLLRGAFHAVPVPPAAHPGVPRLRQLRAVVRQHHPVLRVDRLHRRPARPGEDRLRVLRHRARSGAPVVGAPGDRRQHAGLDHAQRVAGAVLGADGDGAQVRRATRCAGSSSTSWTATWPAAPASGTGRAAGQGREEPAVHPLPEGLAGVLRAAGLHRRGHARRASSGSSCTTRRSSSRPTPPRGVHGLPQARHRPEVARADRRPVLEDHLVRQPHDRGHRHASAPMASTRSP